MVTPRYAPEIGGVEKHVEMLVRGLRGAGWMVEVLTTDPGGSLPPHVVRDGGPVRRFPTLRGDATFFLSPRLAWWLLLHGRRYDLIHGHSYHTPLALVAAVAAWLHRRPFVLTTHYHGTGHTPMRSRLHRPYRALGRWMVRRAALVVCCSVAECVLVRRDFGGALPTMVVTPGVTVEGFATAEPFEGLPGVTVLAGGRLEDYKQVDTVVRAMASLPTDHHLYIFGDGPALPEIEDLARQSDATDRIHLLGRLSQADLHRWFRSADVFVSMSREEAFGLTVIESAVAGAAQVVSDIPAYVEMRERLSGLPVAMLPVDSGPAEVAAAIRATATEPVDQTAGNVRVPTWEAMTDRVISGYRGVLQNARP